MKIKSNGKGLRSFLLAGTVISGAVLGMATIAALPSAAIAQDLTSGSLTGTVKNASGAKLSGATVAISGVSSGYKTTTKTDASGRFRISQIPLGDYNVTITTANGTVTNDVVTVTLGASSNYDFSSSEGSTGQTVIVKGARRTVDFDRNTTGQVIRVQDTIDKIPVGRSIEAIADLVPGISINDVFGPPSISGASPAENIYYINGMNVTNFRNFLGGSTVPFDFYNQVEVKTGGYMAEFGRSTGGAIIASSRSGSNEFHGGVLAYYTAPGLASSTPKYSVDLNDSPKAYRVGRSEVDQKEGTVWLSGPIIKDHLTFFAFYNPRDLSVTTDRYLDDALTEKVTTSNDDPFFGGRLDFMINPNHRFELTQFTDDNSEITSYTDQATGKVSKAFDMSGGKTQIAKYTGKFTDWFTLSALYGKSTFEQTSSSDLDSAAAVFEGGQIVRGNPNLQVESGADDRINYRVDGDFYFNLKGRHHVKIGWDKEDLTADAVTQYSGGVYYRYYPTGTNCGSTGNTTDPCVRVRKYFNVGSFKVENTSYYIQDSWDVTDKLSLNIGVRNDKFVNYNADEKPFLSIDNQWAPRLGLTYDVNGDKKTKLSAFYGRYYLPIAGNTNIRLAGGETFTQDFYTYTSRDATTLVPTLGTLLKHEDLADGLIPDADTLISDNLDPQYQDEVIFGLDHRFENGWKGGINVIYRKLGAVMEDADIDFTQACAYLVSSGQIGADDCGSFGGSGYVLINPGKDLIVKLGDSFGASAGKTVTVASEALGFPEAEREYSAIMFTFERPWDGKWTTGGSVTLSKSYGNIEGGVKSDNGQDDTGLTQDFDEPGWTDGSTGYLPNHHAVSLKLYGSYQISEKWRAGFTASSLSPRKYGCIGYYPFDDGRASQSTATAWYCDGELTPRGSKMEGDWINRIDAQVTYAVPVSIGTLKVTGEVFNLLNAKGADQLDEFGEYGGTGTASLNYGKPVSYQTPRYVRVGLRWEF